MVEIMKDINKNIEKLQESYSEELNQAKTEDALEHIRIKFLGRTGLISSLMHEIKDLSIEEKKVFGPLLNEFKQKAQQEFDLHKEKLKDEIQKQLERKQANFDVTAYLTSEAKGTLHPYTKTIERIEDIFISMGYEVVDGPELENDYNNFEALNIAKDHPARDMQDTFWLTLPGLLMRTHTSSVETHIMQKRKPPIAIIAPGRTYRNEATDASHDFMFMQLEGLFIDKNVSLGNLLATMKSFLQAFFEKKDINIRTRPSYFPFVEPGVEIDMSCLFCTQGCSVCKKTRWIEIVGAGLTHPNVLQCNGINPENYSGFAFGFGLTRLVMLKYGISDIRLLHSNKIDFLKQF